MSSPQKLSDVKFIGYGSIIGILSGLSVWHYQHNHQVEMISLPPHINRHNMVLPNDFFRGNLSSPFTLIEFGNYNCSACKNKSNDILDLLSKYPKEINFVFRHLPFQKNSNSKRLCSSAICASLQGKGWPVHDFLMDYDFMKNNLTDLDIIKRFNLDAKLFHNDLKNKAKTILESDLKFAEKMKINFSPLFLLIYPNGRISTTIHIPSIERAILQNKN